MRGLIIKSPAIEKILAGEKTWEIRGSNTRIRGKIALIRSGSGTVVGTCELVGVEGPLSLEEQRKTTEKHLMSKESLDKPCYKTTYAWVLRNAKPLEAPIPYKHPPGAIIWVKLPESMGLDDGQQGLFSDGEFGQPYGALMPSRHL